MNVFTSISDIEQIDAQVSVYPNPAIDFTTLTLNIEQKSEVSVRVLNIAGQLVSSKNYGDLNGASTININTNKLDAGIYMLEISLDNQKVTKRLMVK
jgi:Secretion system C-terminal sorting domain